MCCCPVAAKSQGRLVRAGPSPARQAPCSRPASRCRRRYGGARSQLPMGKAAPAWQPRGRPRLTSSHKANGLLSTLHPMQKTRPGFGPPPVVTTIFSAATALPCAPASPFPTRGTHQSQALSPESSSVPRSEDASSCPVRPEHGPALLSCGITEITTCAVAKGRTTRKCQLQPQDSSTALPSSRPLR